MSAPSLPETLPGPPGLGHKQAMMAAKGELSPQAALIATQIPRIEPMLRMIESHGFTVMGFNEEPLDTEPVNLFGCSPGIHALHSLLEKRGYTITRRTSREKAVKE